MTGYIEREAFLDAIERGKKHQQDADDIAEMLQNFPVADVRPAVRGKWKPRDLTWGRSYYYCSACEETVDMPTAMGIPMFRYCPNCGADMREGS